MVNDINNKNINNKNYNSNHTNNNETMMFSMEKDNATEAREILTAIYQALKERGYNPINQIVGYILSGDPTYITNHKNARSLVRKLERDELLEEVLKFYLNNIDK